MSFLVRSFAPLRATSRAVQRPVAAFSTSSARNALSESDHSHDEAERDAKIDHHKSDSVARAKQGKGEWKPELGTNSEQGVKADKSDMTVEEMQKLGEKNAEAGKQPSGSSSNKA